MKTKLGLSALLISLFFITSCSKEDPIIDTSSKDGLQEVSFGINSSFEMGEPSSSFKATLQEANIKTVQYRILDVTDGRTHAEKVFRCKNYEVKAGTTFSIDDKLPAGKYWIYFIGATKDIPVPANIQQGANNGVTMRVVLLPDYKTDLFSGAVELEVKAPTINKVEKNIELKRNVGKLEITIKDAKKMPADLKYLYPMIQNFYPNIFAFDMANTGFAPRTYGTLYYAPMVGQNGEGVSPTPTGFEVGNVPRSEIVANDTYVMSLYLMHNVDGAKFNGQYYGPGMTAHTEVYIYGTAEKVTTNPMGTENFPYLFRKSVTLINGTDKGVKIERNKTTTLQGNLFDNTNPNGDNASMTITVKNEWDTNGIDGGTF